MSDTQIPDMSVERNLSDLAALTSELKSLREKKDESKIPQSEFMSRMDVLNRNFEKYDSAQDELNKKFLSAESDKKELEAKLEAVEKHLYRQSSEGSKAKTSEAMECLKSIAKFGNSYYHANREYVEKTLRTDNSTDGGFLVPETLMGPVIKKIIEINPMRSVANVMQTSGKELIRPVRTVEPQASWFGENQNYQQSQSQYGTETIVAHKLGAFVDITYEQLNDSAFNMQNEITFDVAEAIGLKESQAHLSGDGIIQPKGVLSEDRIEAIDFGAELDGDDLINMAAQLKVGYDPVYMFNRRTLGVIRTLKDSQGRYVWEESFGPEDPSRIRGYRYVLANDMPDIPTVADTTACPVLFGDFKKGYTIAVNTGMIMKRDDITQQVRDVTRLFFRMRVGGGVVLPEAIKKGCITIPAPLVVNTKSKGK
jgi:HK97 family phage major capsid protein